MGLTTTHGAWDGAYSSFADWREFIAKKIGISLNSMYGFGGSLQWDNIKDPLKHLLNHSDCDGHISPEHCKLIAGRLDEVYKTITDDEDPTGDLRMETAKFSKGAKKAAEKKENLLFH